MWCTDQWGIWALPGERECGKWVNNFRAQVALLDREREGRGQGLGRGERNSVGVTSAGNQERLGELSSSLWQLRLGPPWRRAGAG